jgi:hypothetical protein
MTQVQPYQPALSYHFANLALTAEIHAMWEADEPDHENIEDVFAIPEQYYDQLFVASQLSGEIVHNDIQRYVRKHYEQIGVIRQGQHVIPDYMEIEVTKTTAVEVEEASDDSILEKMGSYSRRFTEILTNTVRYTRSHSLMGYALRARDNSHAIIAMRGTMTTEEWLNNVNYALTAFHPVEERYGRVHSGFRDVYKGVRGRYRELAHDLQAMEAIYLVGHSMGGVVSMLAALDLTIQDNTYGDQLCVYTYGAPRTGDAVFSETYNQAVGTSYRVVNVCDVVPYLPFEELGVLMKGQDYPYVHTKGERAYVHQTGNPIANHIGSYHVATREQIPTQMNVSTPRNVG